MPSAADPANASPIVGCRDTASMSRQPSHQEVATAEDAVARLGSRLDAGDGESALREFSSALQGEVAYVAAASAAAAVFSTSQWRRLLDLGERFLVDSAVQQRAASDSVLSLLHAVVAGTAVGAGSGGSFRLGAAVDLLCDFLDLNLIPLVLRQPGLREDALLCPCERCSSAARCARRLQESQQLAQLVATGAPFRFLSAALQLSADPSAEKGDRGSVNHALRAVEAIAVLGTYVKLDGVAQFQVNPSVVQAITSLASCFVASSAYDTSAGSSVLAKALHVIRNVAGNHVQVMRASDDVFAEYSGMLWDALEFPAEDMPLPRPRPCSEPQRRRPPQSAAEAPAPPTEAYAEAPSQAFRHLGPAERRMHSPNPQDSEELSSEAEAVQPRSIAQHVAKDAAAAAAAAAATPPPREPPAQELNFTEAATPAAAPDPLVRCAELLSMYSLVLQALFQVDEALQRRVFAAEEALRLQLLISARSLRLASLPERTKALLSFQGMRLYLLVCRSSHMRKQYLLLQPSFVAEERRNVAFLSSLAPATQRCCVILRAMAQDVNSWLLWQSQAPPCGPSQPLSLRGGSAASSGSVAATQRPCGGSRPGEPPQHHLPPSGARAATAAGATTGPGASARVLAAQRRQSRRRAHAAEAALPHAGPRRASPHKRASDPLHSAPRVAVAAAAAPPPASRKGGARAQRPLEAAKTHETFEEAVEEDSHIQLSGLVRLFTSGEIMWLFHIVLVVLVVVGLALLCRHIGPPKLSPKTMPGAGRRPQ